MKYGAIGPVASFVPVSTESNNDLAAQNPSWDMDVIFEKTGIRTRHIATPEQCVSDLGVEAAERLFTQHDVDRDSIDYLLFCTQTPDYPLPTTACLVQDRLGLPTSIGALDYNLGCSGYVYGLSMADGLIRSEVAKRGPADHVRNLLEVHSPDGSVAADNLWRRGHRHPYRGSRRAFHGTFRLRNRRQRSRHPHGDRWRRSHLRNDAMKPRKRKRWPSRLYMDGPELLQFALGAIPKAVIRSSGKPDLHARECRFLPDASGNQLPAGARP